MTSTSYGNRTLTYDESFNVADSSLISAVYFSSTHSRLFVMMNGGAIYGYDSVAASIFSAFESAASAGKFYNAYIKDTYAPMGVIAAGELTYIGNPGRPLAVTDTPRIKEYVVTYTCSIKAEGTNPVDVLNNLPQSFENVDSVEVRLA